MSGSTVQIGHSTLEYTDIYISENKQKKKHVSLIYNSYWYQNVCSLNIYQPRVTSEA